MKQLHTFDEVYDSQSVFRQLLEAMSNPGRRRSIKTEANKLFGGDAPMLAAAMTLLDGSVSFCSFDNDELSEQIVLLTHAKKEKFEQADFLFVTNDDRLCDAVKGCKKGTLEDPHGSASLIVKIPLGQPELPVELSGPGIKGSRNTTLPALAVKAINQRDAEQPEFPTGTDFIFLIGDEFLCIPRLIRIKER